MAPQRPSCRDLWGHAKDDRESYLLFVRAERSKIRRRGDHACSSADVESVGDGLPILEQAAGTQKASEVFQRFPKWMLGAIYATILAVAIAIWLVAVRAPLWLDETVSYWQIHRGFSQIASRQGLSFGAYSYLLWCASKLFGTSEVSLRIPSILAMLGAVYLLYRAARELFDDEIAVIAAVVFCLHPVVAFAAID